MAFFSEGTKKLTNKATLWYVPLSLKNVDKVLEVPPVVVRRTLPFLTGQMTEAGHSDGSRHPQRARWGSGRGPCLSA